MLSNPTLSLETKELSDLPTESARKEVAEATNHVS